MCIRDRPASLELRDHSSRHKGESNLEIVVLESGDRFGGKILSGEFRGRSLDFGPDNFLTRNPSLTELCDQLAIGDDLVAPATSSASVVARGALRPLPTGLILGLQMCIRDSAHTPSWNVGLEARRAKVKINAWIVSRCLPGGNVPGGGHSGMLWARIVKKAANRPLKNINSEPSQTTTPTASNWGPPGCCRLCGRGSTTASLTAYFLVERFARIQQLAR